MIGLVFPSLAGPVTVHLVVLWPTSVDAPGAAPRASHASAHWSVEVVVRDTLVVTEYGSRPSMVKRVQETAQ